MCVVNILSSVNANPTVKTVLNNGKQIWKPKGKLSNNSLNKTKRVWKATGKLFTNVGYQWRPTGKKFTLGKLNCGYQWRPIEKKFSLGELCPLTRLPVTCCSKHMTGNRSRLKNFVKKFINNRGVSNILTKALLRKRFKFLLPRLGMKSLTPESLKCLQEGEDE
ncbi:hypothetical protein Tco_1375291 [Tanacetum coccineum]